MSFHTSLVSLGDSQCSGMRASNQQSSSNREVQFIPPDAALTISFLCLLWGQDGSFACEKQSGNFPAWSCRKESNSWLVLMDKCQYSNLCLTDSKQKVNIVSDGVVQRAKMKLCSDSPTCLNFHVPRAT